MAEEDGQPGRFTVVQLVQGAHFALSVEEFDERAFNDFVWLVIVETRMFSALAPNMTSTVAFCFHNTGTIKSYLLFG